MRDTIKAIWWLLVRIGETYTGIFALVVVVSAAGQIPALLFNQPLLQGLLFPVSIAGLGLAILGLALKLSFVPRPLFGLINPHLHEDEVEIVFTITDRTNMRQLVRTRVKALVDGVRAYRVQFAWTGSGKPSLRCVTAGHTLFGPFDVNLYEAYEVIFPGALMKRDEPHQFEIQYTLSDPQQKMKTLVSKWAPTGCDHLVMKLVLPNSCSENAAFPRTIVDPTTYQPLEFLDALHVGGNHTVTWEIGRAHPRRRYVLSWNADEVFGGAARGLTPAAGR